MNDRRTFLKTLAAVAAAGSHVMSAEASRSRRRPPMSATGIGNLPDQQLPRELPYAERFAMARRRLELRDAHGERCR